MRRLLGLLLLCLPGIAQAEVRPSDINRPVGEDGLGPGYGGYSTQWSIDMVGYFATQNADTPFESDIFQLGPMLRLATPFQRNEVEVALGLFTHRVTLDATDQTQNTWRLTNLFLAHHWTWRTLAEQTRVGLGVTLPTAQLPAERADSAIAQGAYTTRTFMQGWREGWLYAPESMAFTGHADYYWRAPSGLIVGGAAVAGIIVRTSDTPFVPEDLVVVQAEAEIAYDTRYVRSSLTAGFVSFPIAEEFEVGDDSLQIAVEPDFRIRLGKVDLLLGLTLPIDKPAGFGFSKDGFWAVRLGIANGTSLLLPEGDDAEAE